jgi:hypothetical protein
VQPVIGDGIVNVTDALSGHEADPVTAGSWRALCRDSPACICWQDMITPVPAIVSYASHLMMCRNLHRRAARDGPMHRGDPWKQVESTLY